MVVNVHVRNLILGADILERYSLGVDMCRRRPLDIRTQLSVYPFRAYFPRIRHPATHYYQKAD